MTETIRKEIVISAPAGFHKTGRIITWDPPRVFDLEFLMEPHPKLPNGESESSIRWELVRDADDTILTVTHLRLT